MYKCKVVSISCILLSLFYYYFIDIIIFYSIWFLFWWLFRVFSCHTVVSLSALCSSWLCCVFTHATICTLCYHITFVVHWKDFWKLKKKKKRLVQKWLCIAILCVNMQNGYNYFWLWKDSKWGEKNKKKKVLNLCTSLSILCGRGFTRRPRRLSIDMDTVATMTQAATARLHTKLDLSAHELSLLNVCDQIKHRKFRKLLWNLLIVITV